MNLPDVTLLLQIANFTIAYVVMRKLIFAPTLQILEQQNSYKKSLKSNIEAVKTEQNNVMLKQKTSWQQAKQSLYALIPKLSRICVTSSSSTQQSLQEPINLTSQDKKVLVEKLCDQLSDVKL